MKRPVRYGTILLWIPMLLFAALYLVLSFNNRPAADDFYYLARVHQTGIWDCMKSLYDSYSGRWSAYLFTGAVISGSHHQWIPVLFHLATLGSLIVLVSLILGKILKDHLKLPLHRGQVMVYATVLTAGFFFTSYSIGETWFWVVQVCTYLWSILMSLLLLFSLLNRRPLWLNIFLIVLAAGFIGGASESYALINIFLLSAALVVLNLFPVKITGQRKVPQILNGKLILALCLMVAAFAITMAAPGNRVRYDALPHPPAAELFWIQIRSWLKIVILRTGRNLPFLLLFSLPFMTLGFQYRSSAPLGKKELLKRILWWGLAGLILIFIFLMPTVVIMSEMGPDRALSFISFMIMTGFAALGFLTGSQVKLRPVFMKSLPFLTSLVMTGVIGYVLAIQVPLSSRYARAVDARMERLFQIRNADPEQPVLLDSLPPSGMLYSAEITTDPDHFLNRFLEETTGVRTKLKSRDP